MAFMQHFNDEGWAVDDLSETMCEGDEISPTLQPDNIHIAFGEIKTWIWELYIYKSKMNVDCSSDSAIIRLIYLTLLIALNTCFIIWYFLNIC